MGQPTTRRLKGDAAGIAAAADLLAAGQLVAFPTETVYGLGADATNGRAVAGVFEAKGRPRFNPLIVHLADGGAARRLAVFDAMADRLADAFWPGPLTLVLPLREGSALSELVTAGVPTVALRVPDHPVANALLQAAALPLAAPSANPSGQLSPTEAAHVHAALDGRIAAVLDGGPTQVGLESTIVSTGTAPALLRPGGLPVEAIEVCLGQPLLRGGNAEAPTSPGQLTSHYAPETALRLEAERAMAGELMLGFGPVDCDLNLSPSGDLTEAAANLFAHLRALDARGAARIAVSPVPKIGLGLAINDRLARAAAPRGAG